MFVLVGRGTRHGRTPPVAPASRPVNGPPRSIVLETVGLVRRFGGLVATNDVSLRIERGARHALIGPNGAGKTTLINLLTGVIRPTSGRIILEGEDITGLSPDQRVRRGVVRTFQINQLFPDLTPLQTIGLVISRRLGIDLKIWRRLGGTSAVLDESVALLDRFRPGGSDERAHVRPCLWQTAAARNRCGDCVWAARVAAG